MKSKETTGLCAAKMQDSDPVLRRGNGAAAGFCVVKSKAAAGLCAAKMQGSDPDLRRGNEAAAVSCAVKSRASGAAKLRERKDLNKAGGKIRIRNVKSGVRMRSAGSFFRYR